MKKTIWLFVLFVSCFYAPFCMAQQDEGSLVGRWYGQSWSWEGRVQHDFLKIWIAEHKSDGVFDVSFYKCDQDGLEFIVAYTGSWELANGYLSTIYDQKRTLDGAVTTVPSHHLT